ncbi:hypothetical protein, partial [Streptomyces sp. NPDC002758]
RPPRRSWRSAGQIRRTHCATKEVSDMNPVVAPWGPTSPLAAAALALPMTPTTCPTATTVLALRRPDPTNALRDQGGE